jgi:type I restriction enzyme M protein
VNNFSEKANFIWSVADLIRGPYRPNQYKDVMLPLTVLRRLDCVLEPTKDKVLARQKELAGGKVKNIEPILCRVSGVPFYNTSRFTFEKLKGDPNNIAANLTNFIKGFSSRARDIIEHFRFEEHIAKLDKADRLYLVVTKFCDIDLHPDKVPNVEMGHIFEDLIRRFNEASNEEAGDHFTPREIIRLMVDLLFLSDNDVLTTKGIVRTLYDCACGTGGMLSVSDDYVSALNPDATLEMFDQDYNDQAYAVCGSDMMIKGQAIDNYPLRRQLHRGSLRREEIRLHARESAVRCRVEAGRRLHPKGTRRTGLRRSLWCWAATDQRRVFSVSSAHDQQDERPKRRRHAISNRLQWSPLFTGSAGSGESEIRRWIIENDWLEGIVAMPDQLFYNTGIFTYLWILTNRKEKHRKGKIQLIDATSFFQKMRKSLGNKRNEISEF